MGVKILLYNPRKQKGRFAKWQTVWSGPYSVVTKLNDCNYSVKKGRGKPAVVHVDRMRKLPVAPDAETVESLPPTVAESQVSEPVNENNTAGLID